MSYLVLLVLLSVDYCVLVGVGRDVWVYTVLLAIVLIIRFFF